eukprot:scaffold199551_cov16-Prasinocladus_malaysianus.AAC.1
MTSSQFCRDKPHAVSCYLSNTRNQHFSMFVINGLLDFTSSDRNQCHPVQHAANCVIQHMCSTEKKPGRVARTELLYE